MFTGAAQLSFCAQSSSPIPGKKKICKVRYSVTIKNSCIVIKFVISKGNHKYDIYFIKMKQILCSRIVFS